MTMPVFSISVLSLVMMTSMLSSGFKTTLAQKSFSGTVNFTLSGIAVGGGRWSVKYL